MIRALLDAVARVAHDIDVVASDAYLTAAQTRVATHLYGSTRGRPPVELAYRAGMTAPAVSQMLERMNRRGLVAHHPHPFGRHLILVTLTERGVSEYENVAWRLAAAEQKYRIGLGATRANGLDRALEFLAPPLP